MYAQIPPQQQVRAAAKLPSSRAGGWDGEKAGGVQGHSAHRLRIYLLARRVRLRCGWAHLHPR